MASEREKEEKRIDRTSNSCYNVFVRFIENDIRGTAKDFSVTILPLIVTEHSFTVQAQR